MFQDLDLTIRALLDDPAVPPSLTGVDITFKPPDKGFAFVQPTLDLFLYGVHENRLLRDPVPIVERVGGVFVRRTPPLRVDCDYLVTAWSKKPDALGVEEEHRLLGLALAKLSRFPLVPPGHLRNSLTGQPFPVQVWVAQTDDSRSLGEFWSALGVPPRPSFHLMVTIAIDPQDAVPEGPPVLTKQVTLDDDLDPATAGAARFAIGGTVRAAGTGLPVEGADVTLDATFAATTDGAGRFVFSRVGAGDHALRATAPGFTASGRTVTVPSAGDPYDIELAP
ncbi:Pvc16 family protein [Nonomuraea sp. NPDC046570]|uniref:Pvc16 family protein n=1 Tax=Nonomuraea sp. NPDC046570 TaxID=3155255 RepID=UPI0033C308CD